MNEDSWLWFTLACVCAIAWLTVTFNVKQDFSQSLPSVCGEVGCICDVQRSEGKFMSPACFDCVRPVRFLASVK